MIKNFGQMDDRFYRGAQPKDDQFQILKDMGIEFVIDLRDKPRYNERQIVEGLGMKYFWIPMSDSDYPKVESIQRFFDIIEENKGKFFCSLCRRTS